MVSDGFQLELMRLFTLFCGQEGWLCWTSDKETAFRADTSAVTDATLEERVLLRQLTFNTDDESIPNAHHALFQVPAIRRELVPGSVIFHRFRVGGQLIVLARNTAIAFDVRIAGALLQDKWKETVIRQHLARHLSQQEERIESAENRLSELQAAWKTQVTLLLEQWREDQLPLTVEYEPGLADCFLTEFNTDKIREQLNASLDLQRFIQPAIRHIYLTQTMLVAPENAQPDSPAASLTSNQRGMLLLDKYEEAARAAQRLGIAVSGKTIAEHLQPSISPPAITDALKKNRKAISALVHQHPDKWPLLRKHLKPVKELHERHSFARMTD